MQETYPTQPTLLLSEETYALRINVFENDVEVGFHNYDDSKQYAIRQCIEDMLECPHSQFHFDVESVVGSENEWVSVLVCRVDLGGENMFSVPFPIAILDKIVYYSSGTEKPLVGSRLHVHPHGDWPTKVEILLEAYDE
jgi:hypothetical protein